MPKKKAPLTPAEIVAGFESGQLSGVEVKHDSGTRAGWRSVSDFHVFGYFPDGTSVGVCTLASSGGIEWMETAIREGRRYNPGGAQ